MEIQLVCIGKTHTTYIAQGIDEYIRRLQKYVKFKQLHLPDIKNTAHLSPEQRKTEEAKILLAHVQPTDLVILLDEKGKSMDSVAFSVQLQNWLNRGPRQIIFIVGGPYGFGNEVYDRANGLLSLSNMTFSHEMVRLFFTEQLYRAYTIINNEPYHHR